MRRRRRERNTPLARRLARHYEALIGPFPGGIENAVIERHRPGHWQRSAGAWSWSLQARDGSYVHEFGSPFTARECARDSGYIILADYLADPRGEHGMDVVP